MRGLTRLCRTGPRSSTIKVSAMHGPASRVPTSSPPIAARKTTTSSHHGITLADDYAWLRAANWQEVMRDPAVLEPEIRSYLEAENAYAAEALADTADLQKTLFSEMKARLKPDDWTVPSPDGPYAYFANYVTGGQYPRLCRQPREGGAEEVLLDGNAEAAGKPYWDLGAASHSPNHRLLAYAVDEKGSELYTIRVRDLATGNDLPDIIPDTRGDLVWANDSETLLYVRLDENHRPRVVYRHRLGTPASDDALVYAETDTGFSVALGKTLSGRFLVLDTHDHQTSEIHLIDADRPDQAPFVVAPRETGHEYSVDHHGERLFVLTNSDGAEDFRVCEAPLATPGRAHWREVVPHRPGRLILDTAVFKDHLVRLEREDSLPRIIIRALADGSEHAIAFDEEAYALGMSEGYEFDTTTVRFVYSSMTTPAETYDYDMAQRTRVLRKRQEVPSGHTPGDYVTRRLFAPAADGETVPVSLLYRKDTPLDGSAPLFLYGYGSYGISIPASFSTGRLSLVDRGFIYAIAHVRGGQEMGREWYEQGKLQNKLNTFTDFIDVTRYLVKEKIADPERIFGMGGSAGGLLIGAVANMAPSEYRGLIAHVPFVDVVTTMLDESIPLTTNEFDEWGNPSVDPEAYRYMLSYSPYDNVSRQDYPAMLVTSGLWDSQVQYFEPTKWVARLRYLKTDQNPLLLRTNMEAGHGGKSGRFERYREIAEEYAFVLWQAGLGAR